MQQPRYSTRRKSAASILGIPVSSPKAVTRKRFRSLARKHHPDRGGDAEHFKELQQAKEVLVGSSSDDDDHDDSNAAHIPPPPTDDFHHPISATLDDLYIGRVSNIVISRTIINLDGVTTSQSRDILKVLVQPGSHNGDRIVFPGMSDEVLGSETPPGDVILRIKQLPHASFVRSGDDLLHMWSVDLIDSLVGSEYGSYQLEHLDARTLRCPVPFPTRNGLEAFRVRGEGMPRIGGGHGDLYLVRKVTFPNRLSEEQIRLIRMIFSGEKEVELFRGRVDESSIPVMLRNNSVDGQCNRSSLAVQLRACRLVDFKQFCESFPEDARTAQFNLNDVEQVDQSNKQNKVGKVTRRWSVDEDYGFDETMLDEEESCETH